MIKYISFLLFTFISVQSFGADIYVSPTGKDSNEGTKNAPKATLSNALREARNMRRLAKIKNNEPLYIWMAGGTYSMYEPVFVRPEDSGTEQSPTIIQAIDGENPILSGGINISNWKKEGKYWTANLPLFNGNPLLFRQLWVNGKKATRARNVSDFEKMDRICSNDKINQILWVPASAVKNVMKSENLELVIHQMWAIANLRVKSITIQGDSAAIKFHNPEARIQFEHPWPQPMVKKGLNSAFYLTNAFELLDEEDEWYHDRAKNKIYYIPRKGENMTKAEAIVPAIETLVNICGTLDKPVQHIYMRGLSFKHTTWTRPSEKGHVPLQAGMYLVDAYKLRPPGVPGNFNKGIENQGWIGRPPAALQLKNTIYIGIENCRFEQLGSCGIDILPGSKYSTIEGCLLRDIAGNGMQIGEFAEEAFETHLPYDPTDQRLLCTHQRIANNLITDVTNDDWGCLAIAAGFVRDITIEHNEISEVSYSGINLGWGWTKTVNSMRNNLVHANYIHHYGKHMYDVAGIYTLSVQSKSTINDNVVDSIYTPSYVHDPDHWFYVYTDEGSSFITVKDNWTPSAKFLQNANGPGNTWENNGPMVADSIKQRAGLQDKFKHLLNR